MEKELSELFESVKRAADAAENSPGEEDRCLDALERLKKFRVNYQVLVSTQVGKRLRQLTKHRSDKIKALASDVVEIWKGIIVKETAKAKKNGTVSDGDSGKSDSANTETNEAKTIQRSNSIKAEQNSTAKKLKVEKTTTHPITPNSDKPTKYETSTSVKIEKSEVVQTTTKNSTGQHLHIEAKVKVEKSSSGVSPPKLTSLVYCKDQPRDRVRQIFAEALCKVSSEVIDDNLKERVNKCDPYRVAVMVETALFEKWGRSNGAQKFRYRSVVFNLKDQNNPDFRRKVLIGDIEPRAILDLTPEEMASDERQAENEKIKQKALFNSERAAAPKASTNEFTCSRCKKKETTYYQMQTRSADEPMTTFVSCVNCGKNWKFC